MSQAREVHVHLSPAVVEPERFAGGVAVVLDVLRASTTIVQALTAGCTAVFPCADVEAARQVAQRLRPSGRVLLGGERDGLPVSGFDLGNSPGEYTPTVCREAILVITTTNGTRAILHASQADHLLVASFANLATVGEHLRSQSCPIHILCAGRSDTIALDDALLAGALVDVICGDDEDDTLNDGAELAWAWWDYAGGQIETVLADSASGRHLRTLGYDEDVKAAARVDTTSLVPHLRRDPLRLVAPGSPD